MPFVERAIIGFGRERLGGDVYRAFGFAEILEETGDRHDANVILALTKRRPFLGQHADDGEGMPAQS